MYLGTGTEKTESHDFMLLVLFMFSFLFSLNYTTKDVASLGIDSWLKKYTIHHARGGGYSKYKKVYVPERSLMYLTVCC